ncbi:MAG: cysteine peptidase family C39 domain-containing protein [Gemmatimonadota bacterium]
MPFLPQSELLCGGAAATMVLRFWGATGIFPEDFRPLVRPEEGGIRTADLTGEVRRLGWGARSFQGDPGEVRSQIHRGRPVIALIAVGPDRYHFVVIVAWTDDEVLFHDPAEAPFRTLSEEEFLSAWRPADQWALLVLPAGDPATSRGREASPSGNAGSPPPERGPIPDPGATPDPDREVEPASRVPEACASLLGGALDLVREGRASRARERLVEAVDRCPESGRIRAELAGLDARLGAWEEARASAESAVDLAPSSEHAWRILATARYLTADRIGALSAWNRIGEPRIERIRIAGLDGTAYREAYHRMGLHPDTLLTPPRLIRTSRRLSLFPAARESGVRYRPREDGRVEMVGAVSAHPVAPISRATWAGILLRGAATRRVAVHSGSPFGLGELWAVGVRFEEHRPGVSVETTLPGIRVLPGVVSVEAGWERQTYLLHGSAEEGVEVGEGSDPRVVREERRSAHLELTDWATSRLRWEAGVGLDRWVGSPVASIPTPPDRALDGSVRGGVELRDRGDVLSARLAGGIGTLLSGAEGRTYLTVGLHLRWRSSSVPSGVVTHLWADGRIVSEETPLVYWPGAGEGRARDGLLRAHPLLDDGIVTGEAFGRSLVNGGLEARWWVDTRMGVGLAPAAFVDVGRAWRRPGGHSTDLLVDAGVGLRVGVPGRSGAARADVAKGLTEGGWVFQVGWEAPWPDTF